MNHWTDCKCIKCGKRMHLLTPICMRCHTYQGDDILSERKMKFRKNKRESDQKEYLIKKENKKNKKLINEYKKDLMRKARLEGKIAGYINYRIFTDILR